MRKLRDISLSDEKKYFTRCIPVDGEIKDGDLYYNPRRKSFKKVNKEDEIFDGINDLRIKSKIRFYFKAKIFLCSNDIEIGDKIHCEGDGYNYGTVERFDIIGTCPIVWIKRNGDGVEEDWIKSSVYKTIGEISPEANWVKEDMEFSEYVMVFLDKDGNLWRDQYGPGKIDYRGELFPVCKVKCPSCKRFH